MSPRRASERFDPMNKRPSRLKAMQIYVNDVPLFAGIGKVVSGRKVRMKERVTLSQGNNKVEISALNERGIESLRTPVYAEYRDTAPGDLYFVGMGVSQYKDPKLNLQFAHQDVAALASLLRTPEEELEEQRPASRDCGRFFASGGRAQRRPYVRRRSDVALLAGWHRPQSSPSRCRTASTTRSCRCS
jgi:hypothetical protein